MKQTRAERAKTRRTVRQLKTVGRGRAIVAWLLERLSATTTYTEPVTPRTPRHREQTELYGSKIALKPNGLYGADGKPTGFKLAREFSAQPGDIVTSRGGKRTGAPLTRYMVRPDHSLRRI